MRPVRGGAPSRRVSGEAKRLSIRVFTEGERTEPLYLKHWHRLYRERIVLSLSEFHGTPLSLVQTAVAEKAADTRTGRRRGGDAYDQYWCIFDVDIHPRLPEAFDLADREGINVACSNPCIELWFLLHFQDHTAHIERGDAQRRARDLLGCEKHLTTAALSALEHLHEEAVIRAQALDNKHVGDGSPTGSNPSSKVWLLIDQIRSA